MKNHFHTIIFNDDATALSAAISGLDPNRILVDDFTLLGKSSFSGSEACVQILLKQMADPNNYEHCGYTPLHLCVMALHGNSQGIIRSLATAGANLDARIKPELAGIYTYDWTPLMVAAAEGDADSVDCLLAFGASCNLADSLGRTPLMLASRQGRDTRRKVVSLIDKGADIAAVSIEGKRAIDYAQERFDNLETITKKDADRMRHLIVKSFKAIVQKIGVPPTCVDSFQPPDPNMVSIRERKKLLQLLRVK